MKNDRTYSKQRHRFSPREKVVQKHDQCGEAATNQDVNHGHLLILIDTPKHVARPPIYICSLNPRDRRKHSTRARSAKSSSDSSKLRSRNAALQWPKVKDSSCKAFPMATPKVKASKLAKSHGITSWSKIWTCAKDGAPAQELEISGYNNDKCDKIKAFNEEEENLVETTEDTPIVAITPTAAVTAIAAVNGDNDNINVNDVLNSLDAGTATILYQNMKLLREGFCPRGYPSTGTSSTSVFCTNYYRRTKSSTSRGVRSSFPCKFTIPPSGDSAKVNGTPRSKTPKDKYKSNLIQNQYVSNTKDYTANTFKSVRDANNWLKSKYTHSQQFSSNTKVWRCKTMVTDVGRHQKNGRESFTSREKSCVNAWSSRRNKIWGRRHTKLLKERRKLTIVVRVPSRDLQLPFAPYYFFGERGSGFRREEPQDFYKLRDDCLDNGTLFEDHDFPPTDSSLFYSRRVDRHYEWKRPHEIVDNPQFFVEGYSRFDVQQGELGDCWLLAAVANLTLYKRLFFQVVPDDQGFEDKYAGIFHFRFWQYGRWVDVVIDDRLPTYRGQLIFLHSTEDNEFWSALLEKAYAKLHGSYEALKGGSTCEAMEDFTGGVTEMYEMNASPPNLFKIVLKAFERSSLMGASLEPDPNVLEAETSEGLIRGHAYSITRVRYVDIETPNARGKIPLVRLRNPWGNEAEWNGPWSDKSPEWRFIPEHEKQELGLTFDNDGEFWISFKDFLQHFDRLEICNLNPDSLTEEELSEGHKKRWEVSFFEGEWVRGVTAGGCRNYLDSFWHNPQYRITLTEVDDDDEEGKCTLIVGLMQKNRRSQRNMGIDVLTIGFAIYHLPYPDRVPKPLDLNFFKYNASVARSPSFINLREVSCRFKLPPGTYCIVPSTFEPNEEGEFLLRIFSEHQNNMEENDAQIGFGEVDKRVRTIHPSPQQNHVKDQVHEFFQKLAGEDGAVDWMELKQVLDYAMKLELKNKGFSKDVCRSMVAMLDTDHSGKLDFQEFKTLWSDIRDWKTAFHLYDKDYSGTLDGFELRQAFTSAGYNLNYHVLNILMHRYGNNNGQMEFDDFIMCAVKLKTMLDIFESKNENSLAKFSMEEWVSSTMYA